MTVKIKVYDDEPIDKALKRFKRKAAKEGVTKELKRHRFYEKPSERRRRKLKEQLRARRKQLRAKEKVAGHAMRRARQVGHYKPGLRDSSDED